MSTIQLISSIIALLIIVSVIKHTDLHKIKDNKKWQHIVFGFTTLVFVLWLFRVSIYDGLVMHFMALTTLTLVLGFRWSMICASALILISTAIGQESWHMIGVNALLGVYLPIAITYGIFMISFHRIPRQLFVYLFLCAFFPGAITMGAKMMAMSAYYFIEGTYTWDVIAYNYANMTWLMIFPEAFFNGFSMTCLLVYKSDLVYTFHDKFYIDGK